MVYINIIILLAFCYLAAISFRNSRKAYQTLDRREHKLYFLYPLSDRILNKTKLDMRLSNNKRITEAIKALNVTVKPQEIIRLHYLNRLSVVLMVLFLFNLLSLFGELTAFASSGPLKYLTRKEAGEGITEYELTVRGYPAGDQTAEETVSEGFTEELNIQIEERTYSEEELQSAFVEAARYLKKEFLGTNLSPEEITEDLNFILSVPHSGITVEWIPDNVEIIGPDGKLYREKAGPEGLDTFVTMVLIYKEEKREFTQKLHILPGALPEGEQLKLELEKKLNNTSKESDREKLIELPEDYQGYRLDWRSRKEDYGSTLLLTGMILAFILWFYPDKELESRMKKRKDQMLLDYPEIINKLTLLINAGMTVKQAWLRITEEYSQGLRLRQKVKRFAYEEMLLTANELRLGVPEITAYERFGRRTGSLQFLKFSSLITQNLRKGNRGLTELLKTEATQAFEERKEIAKRLGEEAGTKLLVPMMIMLLIIMVIIMIPAFASFGI